MKLTGLISILVVALSTVAVSQSGYELWLGFKPLPPAVVAERYDFIGSYYIGPEARREILAGTADSLIRTKLSLLLGREIPRSDRRSEKQIRLIMDAGLQELTGEGYIIESSSGSLDIKAAGSAGLLYGTLELLNRINTGQNIRHLKDKSIPRIKRRILNHWDNLDRTVERGYSGFSIFNWHELPDVRESRYHDYALANASIGINGVVLTNVNANALVLREDYLQKVTVLADIFRKYGIRVYLTARFSAPAELGRLTTADPADSGVQRWWSDKIRQIYSLIPDFGGFLVKANSEGQPGPQDYGRTHAEGANMLAAALEPHDGIVMWRAFVYSEDVPEDRCKQAYNEFVPLDGQFRRNVMIQVKNGPLDFQPREPVHPLFGAMPRTPLMLELQITKEYLGQGTHLVGLANMYKEILDTDTYAMGEGSTVARITDGSLYGHELSGIAGVSNVGTALNWTGNFFAQADWFAFGRLAWDPYRPAAAISREWALLTFKDKVTADIACRLLDISHEACVSYMTPLGLHHIMAEGHHYGPGPWVDSLGRADWTSVYYHRATKDSVGFDRTASGSNALAQYHNGYSTVFEDLSTCPEEYLLWFHRIPWTHTMRSSRTFWEELVVRYDTGVANVREMNVIWQDAGPLVDEKIYTHVKSHLDIQLREAQWWRDACLAYFQSIHGLPFPAGSAPPPRDTEYYRALRFPYAPGIRPQW